jgi:hypothetical protein
MRAIAVPGLDCFVLPANVRAIDWFPLDRKGAILSGARHKMTGS